jgi:hypothetical protein
MTPRWRSAVAKWWEDKRFDVMDTYEWRIQYCVLGMVLILCTISPAYLGHLPHWRVWVIVAGLAYTAWVTTVFLIMGRELRIQHKARKAEFDAWEAEIRRRYGLDKDNG